MRKCQIRFSPWIHYSFRYPAIFHQRSKKRRLGAEPPHRRFSGYATTIEGSNSSILTLGSSWALIYNNGSTGLQSVATAVTYGTIQTVANTVVYHSYRVLVTVKRNTTTNSDNVEYGEVGMYFQ